MKTITVIPLQKGNILENLTYFAKDDIAPGSVVRVPLRSKAILGLVAGSDDVAESKSDIKTLPFNLKKVLEVKGQSVFPREYLAAALDCARYFAARHNDVMAALLPAVLREEYDKVAAMAPATAERKKSEYDSKIRANKELLQIPEEDRVSVYKTLIRESFAMKKSVYLAVPNEREAETFYDLLGKGIENFTFVFHGGLNSKKILEACRGAVTGEHPILVIGTPQYLSLPRHDYGTIIVERESAPGYHMMARPHLDLRIFAELCAAKLKARLILADDLLRFETVGRKDRDGFADMHPLSFRMNSRGRVRVSGREEKFKVLEDANAEKIGQALDAGRNVFVFSLRKGLATLTVCRDCQQPYLCQNCRAPMVLYLSRDGAKRFFVCNRCRSEAPSDTACLNCGSWNLMPLGVGTDTVAAALRELMAEKKLPEAKIFQLDRESAKSKSGAEKIIKEFEGSRGAILVGTEMALFYLRRPVPLSLIASFDSLWSLPNWKMGEKTVRLILSILAKTDGPLLIQTKNDKDPVIAAMESETLLPYVRADLDDREKLGYPPYRRFVKITHQGDKKATERARAALAEIFEQYKPEIFSGFIAKEHNRYVTHALMRIDPGQWSPPEMSAGSYIDDRLLARLRALPADFAVAIDPEDLL